MTLNRFILILTLFLCAATKGSAATFTVVSNADSGPGTLREAIELANANGTGEVDNILFDFPDISEPGRTIVMQSSLPPLTSNIIIDGTSQAGSNIAISSAKVILLLNHSEPNIFNFIYITSASNIKVLGLLFKVDKTVYTNETHGIWLSNSFDITIGEAGKGNFFSNVQTAVGNAISTLDSVKNIVIQGNICGYPTIEYGGMGHVILSNCRNVKIGGTLPAEGNTFIRSILELTQSEVFNSGYFAIIENNRFNYDGTTYYNEPGYIQLYGSFLGDEHTVMTTIRNNLMASSNSPAGLLLGNLKHTITIQGNKFGTDITGVNCKGYNNAINIFNCSRAIIGGENEEEQNVLNGIYIKDAKVNLIKNNFSELISYSSYNYPDKPFIKFTNYDPTRITGESLPLSKIQLYRTICTPDCLKRTYFATTYADASGKWEYLNPGTEKLSATATSTDGATSEFSIAKGSTVNKVQQNSSCNKSNGSITGIEAYEALDIVWRNGSTNEIVGTDTNLIDVPAGMYNLFMDIGDGCPIVFDFFLDDSSPPPILIDLTPSNPSCGNFNGFLYSSINQSYNTTWLNSSMDSIGTTHFIQNLGEGDYYVNLKVPFDASCNKTYGPFKLTNLSGPTINTGSISINKTTCDNANGSISGISTSNITGSSFIQWVDEAGQPVSNNIDLLNVSSGRYRLKFKDESSCDTIFTPFYTIGANGITTIDDTNAEVTPSNCTSPSGNIRHLQITGGNGYQWINTSDNTVAGNSADLLNVAAGNYRLIVSNNYGCPEKSIVLTVPPSDFKPLSIVSNTVKNGLCNHPEGSVKIDMFSNDPSDYTFRWIDAGSGQTIGTNTFIDQLDAGTYQLLATDDNGCEKMIFTTDLEVLPEPFFDYSEIRTTDDHCHLNKGNISFLKVNGLEGPTVFTWKDQNDNIVGNNIQLENIPEGVYSLIVTDGGSCTVQSQPVIINNLNNSLPAPAYDNITIPRYSNASIKVKNYSQGVYTLHYSASAVDQLQQSNNGNFTINNINSDTSFYIRVTEGTCSSPAVKVDIKVVDQSYFAIPNAFTPNGDGRNDRLPVSIKGYIKLNFFRIYNRWGQVVFETKSINDGWNGTWKNILQSSDTFIWVAEGRDINGNIIKDKGSFVLIR